MGKGLVTKARGWAVECRRLAWAVLKLIYRKMELPSNEASAATESLIGDSQDALRRTELVCPSTTDAGESPQLLCSKRPLHIIVTLNHTR